MTGTICLNIDGLNVTQITNQLGYDRERSFQTMEKISFRSSSKAEKEITE